VLLDGDDLSNLPPHKRARHGIARTFQRLEVFGSQTAYENVLTSAEIHKSWSRDHSDPRAVTEEILDRVGIRSVAGDRVDAMPTGLARLVELGRALAQRPRVLLLDEPASGLDDAESDDFARLLLELAGEGMAILMVEHDVALVMKVCEWIHVLDFGAILAVGTAAEIQRNQLVLDAYLGAG
ncbi:MAG: branched-chain amino acid transport system ATP-binding protein, partial [Nocardioidaceae bacterium]|nr:branched-chain amino acid transport system ATP-binding protein [Nocardioidaceae bacterium]